MTAHPMAMPRLGLGTWQLSGQGAIAAILSALEIGYRHFDTAQLYDNEAAVGAAIRQSGLPRAEIFVTTKIAPGNLADLRTSLEASLERLGVDQVDLTLIHWPAAQDPDAVTMEDYLPALAAAQDDGLTRLIGVSNFSIALIDKARVILNDRPILTNQVEAHVYLQNRKLAGHCKALGISLSAYVPLARGRVAEDPQLQQIGRNHSATPTQVALAFLLQQGHTVLPKSSDPIRQRSNFAAQFIHLTDEELAQLAMLDRGMRLVNAAWAPEWD